MGRSKFKTADFNAPHTPEELALMKKVLQFPEAVEDAAEGYFPNLVANYLWELANLTNTFYETHPVLKAEQYTRASRLYLIAKTAATLKAGLSLLGIDAPERV
jgi:arginyl-tRNA synthetase